MAQPVQQLAIRSPGFQGLNTELSPINGDPEFALVADNVVVDQIGRLVSRKAFAEFQFIGDEQYINKTVDITTSAGLTGSSDVTFENNVATLIGESVKGGPRSGVRVKITDLDCFEGDPLTGSYKLHFSISFLPKSTKLLADPPESFPNSLAYATLVSERGYGYWSSFVNLDYTRVDGLSMPNGDPAHRFDYYPEQTPSLTAVVDIPDARLDYAVGLDFLDALPWYTEYEVVISIDKLSIDSVNKSDRSKQEIIKLGRDVVGLTDVQTQSMYRPVMIYRYGDDYQYPSETRTIPSGMGIKRVSRNGVPELTGDIKYAVATYDVNTNKTIDLAVPDDYKNEALLTGQFVNFSAEDLTTGDDRLLLFVKGKQFLRLDNDSQFVPVASNLPIDGDIAISAYGRVWVTGVGGDYHQVWYSSLLNETEWYTTAEQPGFNDGGVIDVREYWPVDGDSIVNIHAHNGYLLVFGRNSILVYANADSGSPAGIINQPGSGIFLQDAISNVGLVRRDAICNIGTDVLFVDDSGVRSLGRVIQEKSNPLQEPSLNIRRELQEVIRTEVSGSPSNSAIKIVYMPSESIAVLLFSSIQVSYVFHLNMPSKTGGMKVTRWTGCFWNDAIELKQGQEDVVYLAGKPSKGLMKYDGYVEADMEPYVMRYESMALALGQSPMQTTIPKSINYLCMGEYIPGQANALWGFSDRFIGSREFQIEVAGGSEYNVNEFTGDGTEELAGYYPDGGPYYKGYKINTTGSGELFRVGFEVKVQGGRYALQEIDINSAIGRLTA